MKETLSGRVGRLISGSFNALVDAVENAAPEIVMEEAIREIDGVIDEVRTELGRVVANKHMSNSRLMEENNKYEELSSNIELAVEKDRDDLAEAAIAKQLDIEVQIPILENNISDCGNKEKELESYVQALQAKKREMQGELIQYRESNKEAAAVSGDGPVTSANTEQSVNAKVEKAESAFDRVLEKATGLASVQHSTDAKTAAQVAELQDMAHKNRVNERLQSIKNKMKG